VGLIPDDVIGFFNLPNPSSHTVALGSTQPLIKLSTRNLPGGKGWPMRKADNLTAICDPIVYKIWERRHLITLWASMACYRDSFTIYILLSFFGWKVCNVLSHGTCFSSLPMVSASLPYDVGLVTALSV
jgi:hypothetical protein